MRLPLLIACLAAACALVIPATAAAADPTVWLCKPGQKSNPCRSSLTATVLDRDLDRVGVERTRVARKPAIDCFYVYPTTSQQQTAIANLRRDPEIRGTASYQASRFSQTCRVFAPVYRQLTLRWLAGGVQATPEELERPYQDVRAAWREYLRKHNRGRGVVLIGHSQGTVMLRQLVRDEIDPSASQRKRLVSALLLGWNVLVRKGSDVGGDFQRVRACRSSKQIGCVVAFSTYNETPPEGAPFGRSSDPDLEVLCTNPAALGGGSGALKGYTRSRAPAGVVGTIAAGILGKLPKVRTPWITQRNAYRASCRSENGANFLKLQTLPGARKPTAQPESWGLHVGDVNLPLGNLTALVRRQAAAYRARR